MNINLFQTYRLYSEVYGLEDIPVKLKKGPAPKTVVVECVSQEGCDRLADFTSSKSGVKLEDMEILDRITDDQVLIMNNCHINIVDGMFVIDWEDAFDYNDNIIDSINSSPAMDSYSDNEEDDDEDDSITDDDSNTSWMAELQGQNDVETVPEPVYDKNSVDDVAVENSVVDRKIGILSGAELISGTNIHGKHNDLISSIKERENTLQKELKEILMLKSMVISEFIKSNPCWNFFDEADPFKEGVNAIVAVTIDGHFLIKDRSEYKNTTDVSLVGWMSLDNLI